MTDVLADGPWWKTGTLDPQRHYRLIQQRHAIALRAGLGVAYMSAIWEPLPATVSRELRQWLVNVIYRKPHHILVQGGLLATAEVFRALVGALTRNEVDARLMSVEQVMRHLTEEDEDIDAGVLFISDFALTGEPRTEVVKRRVMGTIRSRINAGLPCVLYATDAAAVRTIYGDVVSDELHAHFDGEVLGK